MDRSKSLAGAMAMMVQPKHRSAATWTLFDEPGEASDGSLPDCNVAVESVVSK